MSVKKQNVQNYYLYDTEVENLFISEYMPSAPENAVKLYLLALMHAQQGLALDDAQAAKKLGISIAAVADAWDYWREKGLVRLLVRDPKRPAERDAELLNIREMMYGRRAEPAVQTKDAAPFALDDEAFSKLLHDIESTTGRLLESREPEEVASWITDYGMDPDVILLGYKYSNQKGKSNRCRYVGAILKDWRAKGLVTVDQVEDSLAASDRHYEFYRAVMKELGFHRNATEAEKRIMDNWFDKMGLSLDDVKDACSKTTGISNPNLNYVNSILTAKANEKAAPAEDNLTEENIFAKVSAMYERDRKENAEKTERIRSEVFTKNPQIRSIVEEIRSGGIAVSRAMLRGGAGSAAVAREKERIEALNKEKIRLLAAEGYPTSALDTIYSCARCRDTGILEDGSRCPCFKEKAESILRNNGR